jgi:hypothetical protein
MKLLVNYASKKFQASQRKNRATGLAIGGFDQVASFSPQDMDSAFRARHRDVLSVPRGNGYWLWKPYFILRTLRDLADGDFLFYCDSGAHFVSSIDPLVEVSRRDGQDLVSFALPFVERAWTKRDAFVLLGCDQPEFTDTRQQLASFMLWRKSRRSLEIVEEWLAAAEDPRLISDLPNTCGLPNYPEFNDHRHDQSLFSLITKRYGVTTYRSPSQFALRHRAAYDNSPYGQIIEHTRAKHVPLVRRIRRTLKSGLRWLLTGERTETGSRWRPAA